MSIWNHLPVMAVAAGPKRAREAIEEAEERRFSAAAVRYREQMQFKSRAGAYPFSTKPGTIVDLSRAPW
jgi:hypothetical protein